MIIEDFGLKIEVGHTFGNLDKIWEDIAVDLLDLNQIITNFCYWADGNLHPFGITFTNRQSLFEELMVTSKYWLWE